VFPAGPLPYTPDNVTPLAADPSLAEVDSQLEHTAADIEAAHTAVDTVVDHTVAAVNIVEFVDTVAVAHTGQLAHSSSVQLMRALLLVDCHSLHRSASQAYSVDHSLCKLRERQEPFEEPGLAYYVHNGHRKRSRRELARGKQDRDGSEVVGVR
jgi:hypothetical protein